jgi:hypothetical protein
VTANSTRICSRRCSDARIALRTNSRRTWSRTERGCAVGASPQMSHAHPKSLPLEVFGKLSQPSKRLLQSALLR